MLRLLIEGIDGGRVKRLSAGHADHYMSSSRMSGFEAHSGLKSDIALCPKSANISHQPDVIS
jgi:hypothetical protein